ncbi:MAG: NAD(P)/FAD-dependent oxidoreductase [Gammaproteobacteria bacterium]|nr:NAD(P)/FAD-dependent oxidoreductase [Gammaproteobacteria bacterium]MYF67077.1 NAD(P)/FAD-dependent oxidoreductase [Gammaproteobacteria bacterium]MYK36510.1 NAD(P)/FAD-dependent oxidoreductase [Gammaproteobacteria bacterium]
MTIRTDALIVGAGPCGLFQVFELGLLGISAHLVDALREPGGQCTELYPDKPIYDIPAIPVLNAQDLVDALLKQIEPFNPTFHLGEEVTVVRPLGEGEGFHVETGAGTQFQAKTIFLAGGVGSFQPRKLRLEGAETLEGRQLHYRVKDSSRFRGRRLLILGGGDSALDWALELNRIAESVTLAHRRDEYRAAPASVAQFKELVAQGRAQLFEKARATGLHLTGEDLSAVTLSVEEVERDPLEVDDLLVFFGLAPKLGPIADWGLDLNRKTVNVDPEKFQTNVPGIFAIGDICHYPGKKKLILSGFHEAALAAFAAKAILTPGKKVHLQYTTTSPIMHKRLGLSD